MNRWWLGVALAFAATPATPAAAGEGADAFDFMAGSWRGRQDGLDFSLQVERLPTDTGWLVTQMLDETNTVLSSTLLIYRPRDETWLRLWTNREGRDSRFIGRAANGEITLAQIAFEGRPFNPIRSRIVYRPDGEDAFVSDWQTRQSQDEEWVARENPTRQKRSTLADPVEERIAFLGKRDGNFEIYSIRPDGTDLRRVTDDPAGDHFPRWIAGGRRLAFLSQRDRDDGGWERWECKADGTHPVKSDWPDALYQPKAGMFPEISPNGGYVVYVEEVDGDQEIFRARSGGGGETRLTTSAGPDYRGRWSPDGTTIAFVSERDGNSEIYVMNGGGHDVTRLTDHPGRDRYHRWSPDGRWIAFASDRADGRTYELYRMRPDGSDVERLTDNDVADEQPSWSPDGSHICYRSDENGASEIWVVEVSTGKRRQLTEGSGYAGEPVWSPAVR